MRVVKKHTHLHTADWPDRRGRYFDARCVRLFKPFRTLVSQKHLLRLEVRPAEWVHGHPRAGNFERVLYQARHVLDQRNPPASPPPSPLPASLPPPPASLRLPAPLAPPPPPPFLSILFLPSFIPPPSSFPSPSPPFIRCRPPAPPSPPRRASHARLGRTSVCGCVGGLTRLQGGANAQADAPTRTAGRRRSTFYDKERIVRETLELFT